MFTGTFALFVLPSAVCVIFNIFIFSVNASSFGPMIITMIKDREVILGSKYVYVTCAAAGRYYVFLTLWCL